METKITVNYTFKSKNTTLTFTLAEDEKKEFVELLKEAIQLLEINVVGK